MKDMRFINWNISAFNRNIEEALNNILSYSPDILCIQELPQTSVEYLKKFPGYEMVCLLDTKANKESRNVFLVIATKYKIINTGTYEYGQTTAYSPFIWFSEKFFGRKKQTR